MEARCAGCTGAGSLTAEQPWGPRGVVARSCPGAAVGEGCGEAAAALAKRNLRAREENGSCSREITVLSKSPDNHRHAGLCTAQTIRSSRLAFAGSQGQRPWAFHALSRCQVRLKVRPVGAQAS